MGYNLNFSSQYVDGTLPEWFTDKYHDQLCFNGGLSISSKNAGYKRHLDFENMLVDYRRVLNEWFFLENPNMNCVNIVAYDDDHDSCLKVEVYKDAILKRYLVKDYLSGTENISLDVYGN